MKRRAREGAGGERGAKSVTAAALRPTRRPNGPRLQRRLRQVKMFVEPTAVSTGRDRMIPLSMSPDSPPDRRRPPTDNPGVDGMKSVPATGASGEAESVDRGRRAPGVGLAHPAATACGRAGRRGGIRMVVAGMAASLPLGWLLSYGAMLPAMLGLFFFALFGLVIGATMYRVGARHRPMSIGRLRAGVGLIVAFCWGTSMYFEVREFPSDKAREALHRVPMLPDGMTRSELLHDVERQVRETLKRDHGGDGFFGYAHWALTRSRIEYRVATVDKPVVLTSVQNKGWWAARVVLSVVLLWFGVRAQVLVLARATDRPPADVGADPAEHAR